MARNSGMVINATLDEKLTELINVLSEMNKNMSTLGALLEKATAADDKKVQQKPVARKK